jgi:OmpA-OmpF porin, OOP family
MSRVRMKQTTIAMAIMTGLGLGAAQSANAAYWMSPDKTVIKNSYGECWEALGPGDELCGEPDSDGDGVPDGRDKCPNTPAGVKVDQDGCPLDSDGDGVPDYKDKCPNTPLGTPVDADGCPTKGPAPAAAAGEVIEVVVDHFDFDKSKLKPGMMAKLDELASRINASPANEKVTIVGHTCSVGTEAYNQGLSERRARAVADYLMSKGVSRDAIGASGMGELQPAQSNKTNEGRSANRRVEVKTQ